MIIFGCFKTLLLASFHRMSQVTRVIPDRATFKVDTELCSLGHKKRLITVYDFDTFNMTHNR